MPTYDGAGVGPVVSTTERFDVEAYVRSADMPAVHRESLLAILDREAKLSDELDALQQEYDDVDVELEEARQKLADANANDLLADELRGNYADLVTALRGWLTAYPDHPQLEAELRDHEEVLRGYQPKEEKNV